MNRGKRGLIIGIANEHSIAFGCARVLRASGAELAVTYLNTKAEPYVRPLAQQLEAQLVLPLDVEQPGQTEALFAAVRERWGKLDFVVHSIAFAPAPDLHGRLVDASLAGFQRAMHVSCYSLIEIARCAEPLMLDGGAIVAMTFYGGEKVVPQYNLMGPVKAALDHTVRHLAFELGPRNIRVHAISPGPLRTRAGGGIDRFDELVGDAERCTPLAVPLGIDDVGHTAAFLVSDGARALSANVIHVDGGRHAVA